MSFGQHPQKRTRSDGVHFGPVERFRPGSDADLSIRGDFRPVSAKRASRRSKCWSIAVRRRAFRVHASSVAKVSATDIGQSFWMARTARLRFRHLRHQDRWFVIPHLTTFSGRGIRTQDVAESVVSDRFSQGGSAAWHSPLPVSATSPSPAFRVAAGRAGHATFDHAHVVAAA